MKKTPLLVVAFIVFGILTSFFINKRSGEYLVKSGICLRSIPSAKFLCCYSGSECTKAVDPDNPTFTEQNLISSECAAITVNNFKCIVIAVPFTQIPCVAATGFKECDPAAYSGGVGGLPKDDIQVDLRDGIFYSQNENKTACYLGENCED